MDERVLNLIMNINATNFIDYYNANRLMNKNELIDNWDSLPDESKMSLFLQSLMFSRQFNNPYMYNPKNMERLYFNKTEFLEIYSLFNADLEALKSNLDNEEDRRGIGQVIDYAVSRMRNR